MSKTARFERNPNGVVWGGKIRNRPVGEAPGDFLGRLWALFGPPDHVGDEGFQYALRDRQTGLAFNAYSGASGPAYGGAPNDRAALGSVLDAFDALIDATAQADCEIEYDTDFGRRRVGVSGGKAFERAAPVAAGELQRAVDKAESELQEPSDDPWAYLGPLAALHSAWSRATPDARAPFEKRAKRIAVGLLRATLEKGARLASIAPDDPIRAPFVDAGLDELHGLADSPLLAGEDAGSHIDKLSAQLSSSS